MMKFSGCLYVVEDAERTKAFYKELFGIRVIQDFGANFTMTGGISFQTKDSWMKFIHKEASEIRFGGNDAEIYFETEDIESFMKKCENHPDIVFVHEFQEHDWGQKAVRFYDPDYHIIEVAEAMDELVKRLKGEGLSIEEISDKTMLSVKMIQRILKK